MKEFKYIWDIPKNFTGICKTLNDDTIYHMKNGKVHRDDGAAIEYYSGHKEWHVNGQYHREDGPACIYSTGLIYFYYKGKCYGSKVQFKTNNSWLKKVAELKYLESLEIFK